MEVRLNARFRPESCNLIKLIPNAGFYYWFSFTSYQLHNACSTSFNKN